MEEKITNIKIKIEEALFDSIKRATTIAPIEIVESLKNVLKKEDSEIAIAQLNLMLENFKYGAKKEIPLCQDTGVLNFFIDLGNKFPIISNFKSIIERAVLKATKTIPLRGNSVDPLTNENPENNLGFNVPPIYLNIIENSRVLKITVLPKGGGAENVSRLLMLNPSNGLEKFQDIIADVIKEAGGMPCPPIILGIGLGGDATLSMVLAKKALLRPLNQRHARGDIAKIEIELLNKINQLNIGVMGLGGKITCLDVRIEIAMRHPASFPVGLIVQCYSHRYASFEINEKGEIYNEI
ncbi:MAG: fumarate hydratase [Promethearchaeota archaeon]